MQAVHGRHTKIRFGGLKAYTYICGLSVSDFKLSIVVVTHPPVFDFDFALDFDLGFEDGLREIDRYYTSCTTHTRQRHDKL